MALNDNKLNVNGVNGVIINKLFVLQKIVYLISYLNIFVNQLFFVLFF